MHSIQGFKDSSSFECNTSHSIQQSPGQPESINISAGSYRQYNAFSSAISSRGEIIQASICTPDSLGIIKKSVISRMSLTVRNTSTGNARESYIFINSESTFGFDQMYDTEYEQGSGPGFHSIAGNEKLRTNSIPQLNSETEINFVFIPNHGSNYEIEASGLDLIESPVYLYDWKSRSDLNLSLNPLYKFSSRPGDDSVRFILHFGTIGIDPPAKHKEFNAYYYNREFN